jgi:hypothetical protein
VQLLARARAANLPWARFFATVERIVMKVWPFGVAMVLAAVGPAAGQSISSAYKFVEQSQAGGAFGGYIYPARGTVGLGPESGPYAGVRYSIRLSGPFTIEGETGYFGTRRPVLDTIMVDSARQQVGTADLGLLTANGSLRFNLTGARTWHGFQPFIALGGGVAIEVTGDPPEDERVEPEVRYEFGTSFAGQLGTGIEWYPLERLTLRLDARNLLWKIKTPLPFLQSGPPQRTPEDEWVQNAVFSVGLTFHF